MDIYIDFLDKMILKSQALIYGKLSPKLRTIFQLLPATLCPIDFMGYILYNGWQKGETGNGKILSNRRN
jgi:hypothetical protein